MYLLLDQVYFSTSFQTFTIRIFANLWLLFDFSTNVPSYQNNSFMHTSCLSVLSKSSRHYIISGRLNAFISAARACMHCFTWRRRLFDLVLAFITHSGRWNAQYETSVRRSINIQTHSQIYLS